MPLRLVGRIAPRPPLVAHGADDWLIPPSHARQLHAAAGEPKQLALVERGLHAELILADAPDPLLGRDRYILFGARAPRPAANVGAVEAAAVADAEGAYPHRLAAVLPLVDRVGFDVKAMMLTP